MYIIRYLDRFVNSYKKLGGFSRFTSQKDASCKPAGWPSPLLQEAQDFLQNWALGEGASGGETQGPPEGDAEEAGCPLGKCNRGGEIMLAGGRWGGGGAKRNFAGRVFAGTSVPP